MKWYCLLRCLQLKRCEKITNEQLDTSQDEKFGVLKDIKDNGEYSSDE